MFDHISATKLILLQPALECLRTGDRGKLALFEDLMPTKEQLDEMMIFTPETTKSSLAVLRLAKPDGSTRGARAAPASQAEVLVRRPAVRLATSLARQIADAEDVESELIRQGWLTRDVLEFSPAYCMQ